MCPKVPLCSAQTPFWCDLGLNNPYLYPFELKQGPSLIYCPCCLKNLRRPLHLWMKLAVVQFAVYQWWLAARQLLPGSVKAVIRSHSVMAEQPFGSFSTALWNKEITATSAWSHLYEIYLQGLLNSSSIIVLCINNMLSSQENLSFTGGFSIKQSTNVLITD